MLTGYWMAHLDDDLGEIRDWFSRSWMMMIEFDNIIRGEAPNDELAHWFLELSDCSLKCSGFDLGIVMELLANGERIDVGKKTHYFDAMHALAEIVSMLNNEVRFKVHLKYHPEKVEYWDVDEVNRSVTAEDLAKRSDAV